MERPLYELDCELLSPVSIFNSEFSLKYLSQWIDLYTNTPLQHTMNTSFNQLALGGSSNALPTGPTELSSQVCLQIECGILEIISNEVITLQ